MGYVINDFQTSLTRDLCWQNDPFRGWNLQTQILLNWLSLGHNQVFQPHVDGDKNIVQWSKASNNESVREWEWVPWAPHILCLGSQLHPQTKKKDEITCKNIITTRQNTRSKIHIPFEENNDTTHLEALYTRAWGPVAIWDIIYLVGEKSQDRPTSLYNRAWGPIDRGKFEWMINPTCSPTSHATKLFQTSKSHRNIWLIKT